MSSFADQIQSAKIAHSAWKGRLRAAITTGESEFAVDTVRVDNVCPFGKWLNGADRPGFASDAEFGDVCKLHAEFHKQAANVLELALAGQRDAAIEAMALRSPYGKASGELMAALDRCQAA